MDHETVTPGVSVSYGKLRALFRGSILMISSPSQLFVQFLLDARPRYSPDTSLLFKLIVYSHITIFGVGEKSLEATRARTHFHPACNGYSLGSKQYNGTQQGILQHLVPLKLQPVTNCCDLEYATLRVNYIQFILSV